MGDDGTAGGGRRKRCRACGVDLAGRARVKDAKGNYYCASYAESRRCGVDGDGVGELGLADFGLGASGETGSGVAGAARAGSVQAGSGPIAVAPEAEKARSCPVCSRGMAPGAAVCAGCGFRWDAGIKSSSMVKKSPGAVGMTVHCGSCGYDMGSGVSLRCTECGARAPLATASARRQEIADAVARDAYLRPLITFAACFAGMLIGKTVMGGVEGLIGYGVLFGATMVLGWLVYTVLCLVMLGFDAPQHLVVLRLAALYAASDLAFFVTGFVPIPLLPWVFALLTYISLTMYFLELEINEALIMIVATFAAKVIAALVVVGLLMG